MRAGGCCGRCGRATRGGRGSFLDFVRKQEAATAAVASIEDAAECGERADRLVSGLLGRVMRQRRSAAAALDYIRALARETRANCWELAQKAGHEGPYRMQALLGRYKWSWEELRGLLPGLAQEVLRDDPDDLIGPGLAFDETADLRKGKSTACASPQHAGVTGKVENCVTWVFAALVTAFGQAWIDFDVYMPECWAKDPQRRAEARIPGKLAFATKPELAIAQVKRLMAAGSAPCGPPPTKCTAGPGSSGPRSGRCGWPTSSSSPATTGSPSRRTRSSGLTRQYAARCSRGGPAGTGRKAPATATGRSSPPRTRGSSC